MAVKTQHPKYQTPVEHKVILSYDGVVDDFDFTHPLFIGSYDDCVNHLRNMSRYKWNQLTKGKSSVEIINSETQRLVSYVL